MYVDDGFASADSVDYALKLRKQIQSLLARAGFHLRTSESAVLKNLPPELRDASATREIREADESPEPLGIEWSTSETTSD